MGISRRRTRVVLRKGYRYPAEFKLSNQTAIYKAMVELDESGEGWGMAVCFPETITGNSDLITAWFKDPESATMLKMMSS